MPRLEGDIRGYPIPQHRKKNWQIRNTVSKIDEIPIPHLWSSRCIHHACFFVCLFVCHRHNIHSCYFLQLSNETWWPWVKQSDQSKTKTQTKRKVQSFAPPPPTKWQNIARWGNAIFLQNRKNNTPRFQIFTYIRHERPNERYRNTVKDGFFYQIPLPRRMKNRIPRARLDDTAIPHTKIKITEIPLEKKAQYRNTVNPHVPLTCLQCQGFIFC